MSGVVTECLIRTGRETISLSWTAVPSVARRSVWSIGRPQGARVTRFRSWHSGDEAAGEAGGEVMLITQKRDSFSQRSIRGECQAASVPLFTLQSLHGNRNSELLEAWRERLVGHVCFLNVIGSSSRLNLNNSYRGLLNLNLVTFSPPRWHYSYSGYFVYAESNTP